MVQVPPNREFINEILEVDNISLHTYYDSQAKDRSYGIVYYDQAAEPAAGPDVLQGLLNRRREGWLLFIKGRLMKEHNVFLGNYPGREVIVEAKYNGLPCKIKARFYLVYNRFYQIETWIPRDETFTPEIDAFLQSLALLEKILFESRV